MYVYTYVCVCVCVCVYVYVCMYVPMYVVSGRMNLAPLRDFILPISWEYIVDNIKIL